MYRDYGDEFGLSYSEKAHLPRTEYAAAIDGVSDGDEDEDESPDEEGDARDGGGQQDVSENMHDVDPSLVTPEWMSIPDTAEQSEFGDEGSNTATWKESKLQPKVGVSRTRRTCSASIINSNTLRTRMQRISEPYARFVLFPIKQM